VIVRDVTSRCELGGASTNEFAAGVNVSFQETLVLAGTAGVELFVLCGVPEASPFRLKVYVWPATAAPLQSVPSWSATVSVPVKAVPPALVTVAVSFGSQSCTLLSDAESRTVKHSVCDESLDPV
jgi:hypothetical protein